jgi:hypothetical protein
MSETMTASAMPADVDVRSTFLHFPIMPQHPRLRFIDGAPEGGTEDEAPDDEKPEGDEKPDEDKPDEGEDSLGDAGKKALDAMKSQRNAERLKAKTAQAELDRIKAELALKDKPAEEQALEQARAEARTEATKAANVRILKSELKAAATGKLADPTDAALYINLDDFTVDDNGDVDSDALNEAITDLIARKPHLAAVRQNRFDGDADQGAKGKDSKPTQLSADEVARMNPEQVEVARNAGQLDKLLGITR